MSSACSKLRSLLAWVPLGLATVALVHAASMPVLRVCADPNNLPFSNAKAEGFENRLAEMLANELHLRVEYTWWPQRRGFVRNTLKANRCDIIMGVPSAYELTATTAPYYRSTYVFVTRRADRLHIDSFDDARLRSLRIGLHTIGDDYSNVPPAEALARRGITSNVRGYSIYGDYSKPDPQRALIDAVASGDIDVAIAWGPTAAYFAREAPTPLDVTALSSRVVEPQLPMQYSISMGVRKEDEQLRSTLNGLLERRREEIGRLLAGYGVPLVAEPTGVAHAILRGSSEAAEGHP